MRLHPVCMMWPVALNGSLRRTRSTNAVPASTRGAAAGPTVQTPPGDAPIPLKLPRTVRDQRSVAVLWERIWRRGGQPRLSSSCTVVACMDTQRQIGSDSS
jgi:hypothetical protein